MVPFPLKPRAPAYPRWVILLICLAWCGAPGGLFAQEGTAELLERGDRLLAQGDEEAAEEAYERVLDLGERPVGAYLGLAQVALAEEDWKRASDWAAEALRIDPESLEGHLLYAVSHRERARFRTIAQRLHWEKAERHFEEVLARDSLYRDVLQEYALLRRYHEAFPEAIRLARAQVRLDPEGEGAYQTLFQIYRHYLHLTRPEEARRWLRAHPSDFADFFYGETLRREERLAEADSVYAALLARPLEIPRQPVLLARARVHYAQDRPEAAQAFVEEAIAGIRGRREADFVLEDFKYLLDDGELARYDAAGTPEAYRAFFRALLERRNPMPGRRLDVRLQEHYRRLQKAEADHAYYGYRTWHTNPDKLNELEFTEAYELNEEFNDRGLIYIRHGEPDDRVTAVGGAPMNESWRYNRAPPLDFHFQRGEGGGANNWRLTPRPILANREFWGGRYAQQPRTVLEAIERGNQIAERSRADVLTGLRTDRHTWGGDIEPLDFPYLIAAFRGPEGGTRLEIHYALPVERLGELLPDSLAQYELEVGYAVHDTTWLPIAEERTLRQLPPGAETEAATDFFVASVPSDTFHVALHTRSLQDEHVLGGYRQAYRAPDFSRPGLKMSDLLPARSVRPAPGAGRSGREALEVVSQPSGRFSVREPLHLLFEVYDLARGTAGETRFTVEYTLQAAEGRRRFFGLFGSRDRPVLTLVTERSGGDPSPVEHAELDVSRVDPGTYTLTVEVTDEQAGTSVSRSREIELTE